MRLASVIPSRAKRIVRVAGREASDTFWMAIERLAKRGRKKPPIPIRPVGLEDTTAVDEYWGEHTVNSRPFKTARHSRQYLKWRSSVYPLFKEFMQVHGGHEDETILDYGCGPGDDLTGFALYSGARKIIGIDVSRKALHLARKRLALHDVGPDKIELYHISDSATTVPLPDSHIDFINCSGVLHHTSSPVLLLEEFHRVLKPGGRANIMVYNCDSVWLHLFTAYERQIVQGAFKGMSVNEAFSRNVDGEECPIARCYSGEDFVALCESAGFEAEFVGGYLSDVEMNALSKYRDAALRDGRLADEHKEFIGALSEDSKGYPMYEGKHAGIGGVYRLRKP